MGTNFPLQLASVSGSTAGQALLSQGDGYAPKWGLIPLTSAVSGTLGVSNGGTGLATIPKYSLVLGTDLAAVSTLPPGAAGSLLASQGVTAYPAYQSLAQLGIATLSSPTFTGTPAVPTAASGTKTTQIASTAFVAAALSGSVGTKVYLNAYLSANQSLTTGVATKVAFNSKAVDSGTYYDATTNYRFTPLVAGYYTVALRLQLQGVSTAANQYGFFNAQIRKNGSTSCGVSQVPIYFASSGLGLASHVDVTSTVYMNGTTDYLEGWATILTVGSAVVLNGADESYFQANYLGT